MEAHQPHRFDSAWSAAKYNFKSFEEDPMKSKGNHSNFGTFQRSGLTFHLDHGGPRSNRHTIHPCCSQPGFIGLKAMIRNLGMILGPGMTKKSAAKTAKPGV